MNWREGQPSLHPAEHDMKAGTRVSAFFFDKLLYPDTILLKHIAITEIIYHEIRESLVEAWTGQSAVH
jgi:hypothetical protein